MTEDNGEQNAVVSTPNRRRMLKGVGVAGTIALIGGGSVAARHQDSGPQKQCDCVEHADSWGKYEFVQGDGNCEFVLAEGDDVVEILDWKGKDGDDCEPISVHYTTPESTEVTEICAFGGTDNQEDTDPNGIRFDKPLTNPGGQRAAISNLTFCTSETDPEPYVGYQIDLIHGMPIETFDPEAAKTYNAELRLLQAYWSGTGFEEGVEFDDGAREYQHCLDAGLELYEDIQTGDETATAHLALPADVDSEECSLSEFGLVSYGAPTDRWDPETADQQEVWDFDSEPELTTEDGITLGCFEVDLPPLKE